MTIDNFGINNQQSSINNRQSSTPPRPRCNLCDHPDTFNADSETATVQSNVRKFRHERFTVWRCSSCRSIHARDPVDLAHYYADYPFHRQVLNLALKAVYRTFPVRLKRLGLRPHHSILDYGCGSGHLVEYLKSRGFRRAVGYDAYSRDFSDPAVVDSSGSWVPHSLRRETTLGSQAQAPRGAKGGGPPGDDTYSRNSSDPAVPSGDHSQPRRYDCIIAQDLVEHVEDPRATLRTFDRLATPGGLILIGTPNADAIDLTRADEHLHTLHQPYHTHMLSKHALIQAGRDVGWSLERLYMTNYTNTAIPCLNLNFALHYARCFDNTIDLAFDGLRFSRKLLSLRSLYLALFGYFRPPAADITALFRTPN